MNEEETQQHSFQVITQVTRRLSQSTITSSPTHQRSSMGSRKRERNSFDEPNTQSNVKSNCCQPTESKNKVSIASLLNSSGSNNWEEHNNNNEYKQDVQYSQQAFLDTSQAPSFYSSLQLQQNSTCPIFSGVELDPTTKIPPASNITNLPSFNNLLANVERFQASFLPLLPANSGGSFSISPAGSPYPSPRPREIFRNQNHNQHLEEAATAFLELSNQHIPEPSIENTNNNNNNSPTNQNQNNETQPKRVNALFSNWMVHFKELKDFKQRFGHTNVTRTTDEWKNLGNWVAAQRKRMRKGKLPKQQFELLSSLGFEWDRSYYFQRTDTKRQKKEEQ